MIAIIKAALAAISAASLIARYAPYIRGFLLVAGGPVAGIFASSGGLVKALLKRLWGSALAVIDNPWTCLAVLIIGFGVGFVQGDKWGGRRYEAVKIELETTNAKLAAFEARDDAEAAQAALARKESVKIALKQTGEFKCVVPLGLGAALSRIGK